MIVVLDCNIWITLSINRQLDFIADLFDNDVTIASCNDLLNEITSVLNRPKFKRFVDDIEIEKVTELHNLATTYFKLRKIPPVTADPKDDYLFALALKSKADYQVTGDKLLLNVSPYKNTRVISLSSFRTVVSEWD